jgi:outer membrane lipoprotein-sorting protein
MVKKLAAITIPCLLIALSLSALQGPKRAFASRLPLPEGSSDVNSSDSEVAIDIIEQVAEKSGSVSFKATKTVILWNPSGTSACISNIIHKAPNLTKTEYLPSSASVCGFRTVISDGKSTWHYEPSLQVVFYMPERPSIPDGDNNGIKSEGCDRKKDMLLIKANYNISLIATENLVGRQAHVIQFEPRHPGNPSRKIWVDKEYPFILKTEQYGPDGTMSSVSFYNQIEFFPQLGDDLFRPDIPPHVAKVELPVSGDLMPLDRLEREADFPIPMPGFVPPGYVIEGGILSLYKAFPAAHIRLTDGLNTISYFVSPRIARDVGGRDSVLSGSDISGANVLKWSVRGYDFTLVGEVDESLLEEMARSVSAAYMPGNSPQQSFSQYLGRFFYQLFLIDRQIDE